MACKYYYVAACLYDYIEYDLYSHTIISLHNYINLFYPLCYPVHVHCDATLYRVPHSSEEHCDIVCHSIVV